MSDLIYDLIIAAVLVIFMLMGRRKGFILTLCGLLAVFVAFVGAAFLSDLMCEPVGDLIRPMLEQSVSQALDQMAGQSVQTGRMYTNPYLTPELAVASLEESGLYRIFGEVLTRALEKGALQGQGGGVISAAIAAYLAREVARIILFVLAFVVILLVWFMLSHALDLAFRLPVLSTVNAALGGVLGLVKGGLVVFIAVWLLREHIPAQVVENTFLLKFFCQTSPLTLVAQQIHALMELWELA